MNTPAVCPWRKYTFLSHDYLRVAYLQIDSPAAFSNPPESGRETARGAKSALLRYFQGEVNNRGGGTRRQEEAWQLELLFTPEGRVAGCAKDDQSVH